MSAVSLPLLSAFTETTLRGYLAQFNLIVESFPNAGWLVDICHIVKYKAAQHLVV